MRPAVHVISLLGILSLSLVSMSGCGEKRIHVSTASGAPGQEAGSSISDTDSKGLTNSSVDESSLKGQAAHPPRRVRRIRVSPSLPLPPRILLTIPIIWMNHSNNTSRAACLLTKTLNLTATRPLRYHRLTMEMTSPHKEMTSQPNPALQP